MGWIYKYVGYKLWQSEDTRDCEASFLSIYVALIAYVINTGSADSDSQIVRKLIGLYKTYHGIVEFVKVNVRTYEKYELIALCCCIFFSWH